ncbi:hypothetical protein [Microbacterium sp.]|uniref:hypothetical protein n=1 Tax=Microbacterium sp. TaxID=51671 RepID=UPI003A9498B4
MVAVHSAAPSGEPPTRAAARAAHATQRRRNSWLLLAISAFLAVALVAVIAIIVTHRTADGLAGAGAAASGDCLPSGLRITADPAVADALQAIIDRVPTSADCRDVRIRPEDSATTAAALAAGDAPNFDLWVPDSAMWPARVGSAAKTAGVDAAALTVSDAIASTPVVFAASAPTAAALAKTDNPLAGLAEGKLAVVTPDPTTVAASDAALLALQTAVDGDARRFTGLALALAPGVVRTAEEALKAASTATTPTIAVTTEQELKKFGASSGLVSLPLFDLAPVVSIPIVTAKDASADITAAVKTLTAAVAKTGAQLTKYGLRSATGEADGAEPVDATIDATQSANRAEVLRTWQTLTAPSRMLSLNDVSGSMNEPASAGLRRIDLFEKAAVRAINALSTDSSLAIWVFSSRRIGGQDWQEIVPFGALGDPAQKQKMIDTANKLDSYVGGGTGLYDSMLAAVQHMHDTYVEGQVNLVLLNTDGVNEDDDGLDLNGLLTRLKALHDPAKPVSVIAIGYGPDTDQDALEKIAAATDGAAYQALKPTDITSVLVDAVTQRGCRPNCG